jgi:hypothetical protein
MAKPWWEAEMNHKAIVLKQYTDKATRLRAELADTETAIRVLGGTVTSGPGAAQAGRTRARKVRKPNSATKPTKSAANGTGEVVPADLQAQIDAIKADPKLKGIQIAQAVRRAKLAYYNTARRAEGAVLGEAAEG